MDKPQLAIDVAGSHVVLTGAIDKLTSHRTAWNFLRNEYKATRTDCNNVFLEINNQDISQDLIEINKALTKYGFEIKHGSSSNIIVQNFENEEQKFAKFSKLARDVRNFGGETNNPIIISGFNTFKTSIQKHFKRSVYDLQLLSAYYMAFAQNSCNFSVPGSGKTSIVYAAYSYLKNLPDEDIKKVDRILVVGPLSSFDPWEMEYYECFGHKVESQRISGAMTKREKERYFLQSHHAELTLVSYQSLLTLIEPIKDFLNNNKVMVVLDEAHKAKNTDDGVIAKSVLEISNLCTSRIILTGTPAPNGYQDLYNMFKFIWPNKNIIGFNLNRLCGLSDEPRPDIVSKLVNNIEPFFIRIRKSDLKLPKPVFHQPITAPMGPIQKQIYDFIEKRYMDEMINEHGESLATKFKSQLTKARIIRLMQAASNPVMLKRPLSEFLCDEENFDLPINDSEILSKIANYEKLETPPKFEKALELVTKILERGEKVVIWAIFIDTIHKLKYYLKSHGIESKELYGAVPTEEKENDEDVETRGKIIKDFHDKDSKFRVIIANPFAVAESISLHKACNNAIYLEKSFDAAKYVQSKDRIHRVGLAPNTITNYYNIITENTIDHVIDERLAYKEKRMNEIMESDIPLFDNASDELGNEDIRELIKDYVRRTKK